jgi:hypothetical protein
MTQHDKLVAVARKWLMGPGQNCTVVITELSTSAGEIPDAIGWKYDLSRNKMTSTLVECKTSLKDLKVDFSKTFRWRGGVGEKRYFLMPAGISISLIDVDDVFRGCFERWGQIEWDGKQVKVLRASAAWDPDREKEIRLLTSAMRRAHFKAEGISARFFTRYRFYQPKNQATVTTLREMCHGCKTRLAVVGSKFCLKCQEIAVEDDSAPD